MKTVNRRSFLKASGLSTLPLLAPALPVIASDNKTASPELPARPVHFLSDGEFFNPDVYISLLQQVHAAQPIRRDVYGNGGTIAELEKKFAEITGKEKAMFMPTGTMANQLAIHVLSGENTKVFVQETSHVYRDEADAAQSVFGKRLIPLAKGEAGFTLEELQQSVDYHLQGEVFKSGIGVVSIENPVRRADGRTVSLEEMRKISAYCRQQGFKLHLDGARLHMASAWTGVSIAEYAALFDTVYISLYKYLGAAAGAILCGSKQVMDKMTHLMKIHGGAMLSNWANAAMALKHVEGIDERLKQARKRADELFAALNQLPETKITGLPGGTNIYTLRYGPGIDARRVADTLAKDHNIRIGMPDKSGDMRVVINETILFKETDKLLAAFKTSLKAGRG